MAERLRGRRSEGGAILGRWALGISTNAVGKSSRKAGCSCPPSLLVSSVLGPGPDWASTLRNRCPSACTRCPRAPLWACVHCQGLLKPWGSGWAQPGPGLPALERGGCSEGVETRKSFNFERVFRSVHTTCEFVSFSLSESVIHHVGNARVPHCLHERLKVYVLCSNHLPFPTHRGFPPWPGLFCDGTWILITGEAPSLVSPPGATPPASKASSDGLSREACPWPGVPLASRPVARGLPSSGQEGGSHVSFLSHPSPWLLPSIEKAQVRVQSKLCVMHFPSLHCNISSDCPLRRKGGAGV